MEKVIQKIADAAGEIYCAPALIAIDGRCGSGKSTLADMISSEISIPMAHMDHFFLRPEQRTPERLAEPGGNVDRERFLEEVLLPLRSSGECSYRPYDCGKESLADAVAIPKSRFCIIEGSYSCHPNLWDYYDLHVFLTVDPEEQLRRIIQREGEEKAEMFRTRWIPMEEKYFDTFGIADRCDLVFDTTDKMKEMRELYENI